MRSTITQPQRRRAHRRAGFTIIEVLVVVVIIGVLAALIVPSYFGRTDEARRSVAQQQIDQITTQINLFQMDHNRFPESLNELIERPSDIPEEEWNEPDLSSGDLEDPWGNPFQYTYPGQNATFDLYSLGADGQQGGEGVNADITNWDE